MATQFASFYAALISAWGAMGSQPSGTSPASTPILSGNTPAQNLAILNAWTVVGTQQTVLVQSYRIYNAIVPSEFQALAAANQQLVRDIIGQGTVDGSPGSNAATVLAQVFGVGTTTRTNLVALQASFKPPIPWWQSAGLPWAPTLNDLIAAGLVANSTMWTFTPTNKRRLNFNIVVDVTYAQVGADGTTLTGQASADSAFGSVSLSNSDVSIQALKRIVNVLLPGDAALAALTAT